MREALFMFLSLLLVPWILFGLSVREYCSNRDLWSPSNVLMIFSFKNLSYCTIGFLILYEMVFHIILDMQKQSAGFESLLAHWFVVDFLCFFNLWRSDIVLFLGFHCWYKSCHMYGSPSMWCPCSTYDRDWSWIDRVWCYIHIDWSIAILWQGFPGHRKCKQTLNVACFLASPIS